MAAALPRSPVANRAGACTSSQIRTRVPAGASPGNAAAKDEVPVRHARSETRSRPPCGRRGGIGKNGSTRSHNGSGRWATNHSGARGGRWCIRTLVRDGQIGNPGLLEILRLGDFREILRSPNHQLAGFEAEIFNPDGSTFKTTITQLNPPKGVETTMTGGPFDGARFVHSHKSMGGQTKVDLEGNFPAFPRMPEAEELMINRFFTAVFAEDTVTLRNWHEVHA
jgi:hypothetical protein